MKLLNRVNWVVKCVGGGQSAPRHVIAWRNIAGQIGALRHTLIGRIERAEAADETLSDRTLGLIGLGVPHAVIETMWSANNRHQLVALTVADEGVNLALIARGDREAIVCCSSSSPEQVHPRQAGLSLRPQQSLVAPAYRRSATPHPRNRVESRRYAPSLDPRKVALGA